jgi:hypothetical protein
MMIHTYRWGEDKPPEKINFENLQDGFIEIKVTIFAATGFKLYTPEIDPVLKDTGRQRVYWTIGNVCTHTHTHTHTHEQTQTHTSRHKNTHTHKYMSNIPRILIMSKTFISNINTDSPPDREGWPEKTNFE